MYKNLNKGMHYKRTQYVGVTDCLMHATSHPTFYVTVLVIFDYVTL
jgi:hypothetical protein